MREDLEDTTEMEKQADTGEEKAFRDHQLEVNCGWEIVPLV